MGRRYLPTTLLIDINNVILHKNYNFYNMSHDCVYNLNKKFVIIIITIIENHIKIKNSRIQKI